jgi:hypothetical protein
MKERTIEIAIVNGSDLLRPASRRRAAWGTWRLRRSKAALEHVPSGYSIPLEWCAGNAALLDWILQLHGKPWLSDADFRDLVRALDDIFAPQFGMCSYGADLPTAAAHARRRLTEWGVGLPAGKKEKETHR